MELTILTPDQALEQVTTLSRRDPNVKLLVHSPGTFCREMQLTNELDCFHSKSSTLAKIGRDNPNVAISLLVVMINDLANSFNIGKNMGAVQVMETAQLIFNSYSSFKIADFALFFSKAKTGYYGKVYDRLDCAVICEWLNVFDADKDEQVEAYWKREQGIKNLQAAEKLLPPADSETAKVYIRRISEDLKQSKFKKVANILKTPEPRPANEMQIIHSAWMNEFNRIWEDNFSHQSGKRFIKKWGRMLDINEFLERRQHQYGLHLLRAEHD